jgi:hypothetical protein
MCLFSIHGDKGLTAFQNSKPLKEKLQEVLQLEQDLAKTRMS